MPRISKKEERFNIIEIARDEAVYNLNNKYKEIIGSIDDEVNTLRDHFNTELDPIRIMEVKAQLELRRCEIEGIFIIQAAEKKAATL